MQSVSAVSSTRNKRKGPWWSGDPSVAPRCGAKTRSGAPCRAPAMRSKKTGQYTRCRMHGGASTGPRTPEGLERCRKANWKHGKRSAKWRAEQRRWRLLVRLLNWETDQLAREVRAFIRDQRRQQREQERAPAVTVLCIEPWSSGDGNNSP